MGIFDWIFGGSVRVLAPGRGWIREVHGESHYQHAISLEYQTNGGTDDDDEIEVAAILIPEPGNPYDANAVRVELGKRIVGYLPREDAAKYKSILGETRTQCSAKIVGGFLKEDGTRAFYGVRLNMSWPPKLRD